MTQFGTNRLSVRSRAFLRKIALFPALVGFCTGLAACSADNTAPPGSRAGSTNSLATATAGAGAGNVNSSQPASSNNSAGGFVITMNGGIPNAAKGTTPKIGSSATDSCASGMQSTSPVTPTVWLVVDGSSSMNQEFETGKSRWLALRSTLMDKGGVVDTLQPIVRFGMVIYSGGGAECVQLVTVNPALNNLAMLSAMYPMQPLGMGTPTDKALDYVVKNLPVLNTGALDMNAGPVYVVLATDGSPNDMCGGGGFFPGGGGGGNVEQRVIDVTAEGTSNGMQMFVISMAGDDNRLQDHLKNVAAATASKTPPFIPATQNDLIGAFQKIVGSASCLIALNGNVEMGKECTGTVRLNSEVLRCNEANGWMLFDPSTVQLAGSACDTFLHQQSLVMANFPCEVFSPN